MKALVKVVLTKLYRTALSYAVYWRHHNVEDGYTIAIGLPADIPCLAKITFTHLARMDLQNCKEVLIVADQAEDTTSQMVKNLKLGVPHRVIKPNPFVSALCKITHSPFKFHWAQLVTALNECHTKYLITKGSNFYIREKTFYQRYYAFAEKHNVMLTGIKKRGDVPGGPIGTFEMMINTAIKHNHQPIELLARVVDGTKYDNFLYVQKTWPRAKASRVKLFKRKPDAVHIRFLIGSYRQFMRHEDKNDSNLRVWFICLLNELFKGTEFHNKALMTLKEYYTLSHHRFDPEYSREFPRLFKDIVWICRHEQLDVRKVAREIKAVKKLL